MAKLLSITGKALTGEWGRDDDTGNGIPVLRTTNFSNEGTVNFANVVTRIIDKKNIDEKFLRNGDIIIEKSGGSDKQPVGRVIYYDGEENKFLFNNFTGLLRVQNQNEWFPKFVFYALFANYWRGGTKSYENKTTGLHNLKLEKYLQDTEIRYCPLDKQNGICNILDRTRRIIALRKSELDKYDNLIKARFVEMFGDPESNPFKWKKQPLAQIIVNANNGMARRGDDILGNIVLRLVELQNGVIDYSTPNRIVLNDIEKKRYHLVENDFLFARVNGNPDNVGRCAVFHEIGEPVYHNDHIIRVHFNDNVINGCFASVLLNSRYGKKEIRSQIKTSAGQYTISQEGIGKIFVIIPPIHMQKQFSTFISQIDKSKFISFIV